MHNMTRAIETAQERWNMKGKKKQPQVTDWILALSAAASAIANLILALKWGHGKGATPCLYHNL